MRRALLASVALVIAAAATPAAAQSGGYLNWAGRPEPTPAQVTGQPAGQTASGPAWRVSNGRINPPPRLAHGGYDHRADPPQYALTAAPGSRGDALTPASAWTQAGPVEMAAPARREPYRTVSSPAQAYLRHRNDEAYYRDMRDAANAAPAQPTYAGDAPAMRQPVEAAPAPVMNPAPVYAEAMPSRLPGATYESAAVISPPMTARPSVMTPPSSMPSYVPPPPTYVPSSAPAPMPTPAPMASVPSYAPVDSPTAAEPSAPAPAEVDPMAPRRDAPIFRIQRERAEEAPGQQPSRRYSVHRQNGQEPDPTELPEGGYIDGLSIGMPESLASEDLARPPDPPVLTRDAQGRVRAMPARSDGDHQ